LYFSFVVLRNDYDVLVVDFKLLFPTVFSHFVIIYVATTLLRHSFIDNVRILCLSFEVKKFKTTKLSYRSLLMNQVPQKLYLVITRL